MPVHSIPVTLAEVLEVRGMVLDDWELWALLYTASAWLLDLLNRGKACTSDGWPSRVVSADTLAMFPHGNVHITAEPSFREVCTDTLKHFVSVECSLTPSFSNKAVERLYVYSLGTTMKDAASCHSNADNVPEQKLSGLSLLLDRMCCEDGATRASLQNVVDTCSELQKNIDRPASEIITALYCSVLGDEFLTINKTMSRERRTKKQSLCDSDQTAITKDESSSNNQVHRTIDEQVLPVNDRVLSSARKSLSFPPDNQNTDNPLCLNHASAVLSLSSPSLCSPSASEMFKSLTTVSKGIDTCELNKHILSTAASDSLEQHSTASPGLVVSENLPVATAALDSTEQTSAATQTFSEHMATSLDSARDQAVESEQMKPVAVKTLGKIPDAQPAEQEETKVKLRRVSEISLPVADLSLSSASEVYVHHHSSSVALFTSHHHAADDSTASADVHSHTSSLQHRSTAQDWCGPEFLHIQPTVNLFLPDAGRTDESQLRNVTVLLLSGVKLDVMCSVNTTGRQLYDFVISHLSLPEPVFFGLTFLRDGEHFFIDAETKLHRVAPVDWKEHSKKAHRQPVTFLTYFRVKFYISNVTLSRQEATVNEMYLQLRSDLLSDRFSCTVEQTLCLGALALRVECPEGGRLDEASVDYYIAASLLRGPATRAKLYNSLLREYEHVAETVSRDDAKILFIQSVTKLPEYGYHFYKVFQECPKCNATIEKDGGCNHMVCKRCKFDFCWVCLTAWEPHGSSWYNCNRYDEEEAKKARDAQERSRAALQRYLFYCNRYMNHMQSLRFENKLYAGVKERMEAMQQHNMSWIEVQFLKKAVDVLCQCRQTLMYTYVFAFYLHRNNQSIIFEDNQKDLENATEQLSEYLERDITSDMLFDIKQKVQDKSRYCESRCKVLLDHVHEGYDKDWWEYKEIVN